MEQPQTSQNGPFGEMRHFTLLTQAKSRLTPPETLDSLARKGDYEIWGAIARNPRTSVGTIEWLLKQPAIAEDEYRRILERCCHAG